MASIDWPLASDPLELTEALNTTSGASTPEHQITADLEPHAIDIQAITDSLTGNPQTQTSQPLIRTSMTRCKARPTGASPPGLSD